MTTKAAHNRAMMSNKLRYAKNYNVDGHPICDNEKAMTKQQIIDRLNEQESEINVLNEACNSIEWP